MRTDGLALALVLVAGTAAAQPEPESRLEFAIGPEVTLVGLTYGARPEVLVRLFEPGTVSRLRVAVGVLAGPDQVFVPVSVGYRAVFRQRATVQPLFGVGLELQSRSVPDAPVVRQFGAYLEGGVGFVLTPGLSLGAVVGFDLMLLGGPGVGLGPRVMLTWRP